MSLYSLLAVINFLPSVFGDEIKDRLMYSSDVKNDYPSKHEWSTRKWAPNKYDDEKYYDDDNYRSSKQWQRPKYPYKDSKEWKKDDYTKGNVYSHGSYSVHKDEPVKDDWKKYDPKDWKKDDGKYGSKYSKSDKDKKEYPSKDDDSSKYAEVYGMAYSKSGVWFAPIKLTPIQQQHTLTCWAACTRMLLDLTNKHYETDQEICDIAGISISATGVGENIAKVMKTVCGGGQCKYKYSKQTLWFTPPSKRGNVGTAQRLEFADAMDREYIMNYIYSNMYLVVSLKNHAVIFDHYKYDGNVKDWFFYGVDPDTGKEIEYAVDPNTGQRIKGITWTTLKDFKAQTLYAVGFPDPDSELRL